MKLKTPNEFMQAIPIQVLGDHRFTLPIHQAKPRLPNEVLPINDALQIKAAEYWLKLGEADQALRELEHLPKNTWKNPSAIKIRVAAIGMLRERGELAEAL